MLWPKDVALVANLYGRILVEYEHVKRGGVRESLSAFLKEYDETVPDYIRELLKDKIDKTRSSF